MGAQIIAGNVLVCVILLVLVIVLLLNLAAIGRQPSQKTELSFKVRLRERITIFFCIITYGNIRESN